MAGQVPNSSSFSPASYYANGLSACTFDDPQIAGNNVITTSGTIYGALLKVYTPGTVSNIYTRVQTAYSALTYCRAGLYSIGSTCNSLYTSPDMSAALGSTGRADSPFSYTLSSQYYFLCFLAVGTVGNLYDGNTASNIGPGMPPLIGVNAAGITRGFQVATGQAALPSSFAFPGAVGSGSVILWGLA